MDEQKNLYREEAYELLGVLEDALLELEGNPTDMETVGKVFRAMHTIKGSGAMFGFEDIASFTHAIESVYDMVREGKIPVTPDLISLTLVSCDQIKAMLDASKDGSAVDEARTSELTVSFRKVLQEECADSGPTSPDPKGDTSSDLEERVLTTYRIRFSPYRDLFANGTNPVPLLNEIRAMGESSIVCSLRDLPEIEDIDPEGCYATWDIVLTTDSTENEVRDVFIFVDDMSDITIEPVAVAGAEEYDAEYKKVGEILVKRGALMKEDLDNALQSQKRIGEVLQERGLVGKDEIALALAEQEQVREARKKRAASEEASSIRVPAVKLDALVNMVGELVTVQARLSQYSARKNDPDLVGIAEEVERLSSELRDIAMGIRMLPLGTTFAKFKRLVRDLSSELGKDICFTMEGEETELDKTVIDKLSDPLVHLIRNSIDHGIESPASRAASGKRAQGTIKLAAQHSGAFVLISVSDDGAGLDADAIRSKAVEKGIIPPDAALSEQEVYKLIFAPGFSTAANVTSVSGRGVGMDVVKTSIEGLGGTVEIVSSKDSGTTITLKLPLTLAIIDGLLIGIGGESFIIPLGVVEECVDLTKDDVARAHGRHLVKVREEIIPYIYLRECFNINGKRPATEQVVITDLAGTRVGFVVDKVIGQHQTVIKNLGRFFRETEGVSGATIMGDGSVALILDVNRLMHRQEMIEASGMYVN